jgi:fibronectin type 3 domain-containing protein
MNLFDPFETCNSKVTAAFLFLAMIFAMWFTVLSPVNVHAANVQTTWNANVEADLAGYKVYCGTASKVYGAPVDVGKVTSYTQVLAPNVGTTYYFAVTAYDTSGNETAKSVEVNLFIGDSTAPAAPTGILSKILASIVSWFHSIWGAPRVNIV